MRKKHHLLIISVVSFLGLIFVGTLIFSHIEKWPLIDSFFYTTMTVTTIGYGDLVPTHDLSKIITSVFAMVSIPVALFLFGLLAEDILETRLGHFEKKVHEIISREKEIEKELEQTE